MKDLTARPFATLPLTLSALRSAYEAGADPRDILDEVFFRLGEIDDPGIFIHLIEKSRLLEEAAALGSFDPSRPLWGIPFAVKDNIDLRGIPTTAACPAYSYVADQDAFVVARLRTAGAIPIGKTNLDQFATGLVGIRSPYAPPRNALDPGLVPGGSSSGSAVVVAHGALPFALGTDTAGSGRVPAALNGIVGLKPSLGILSARGVVPACRTLDTVSIFATTVQDAYAVLCAAAEYDPKDAYARDLRPGALPAALPVPRVAVPGGTFLRFYGDEVQAASFGDACARLRARGAEIVEIDFTAFYEVAELLYEGAWVAERFAVVEDLYRETPDAIHPVTRQIVGQAETMSAADAFRGYYRLADLKRFCASLMAGFDMLCVPTIPTFYSLQDLAADPVTPNSNLGTYTNFVNLLDLAALALPTDPRSDGRPGSITLIGPAGADARLAAEAARLMAPAESTGAPTDMAEPHAEEIAVAVCGAHMSGLPLNTALTARGGRFLKTARTTSDYRLYALPGGPPARPGLVRQGHGAPIEVEIWAMPQTQIGALVEEIPCPLGLGRVRLEDNTEVTGFVCETAGVEAAQDITDLGGWRAYLAQRDEAKRL